MQCTIFYSWQSDQPGNTNRYFILDALKSAVQKIAQDESIKIEPRVDHDTAGVAGAPDIVATILSKIEQAQVFVCDVSIINPGAERPTPNPNVLVELGYAIGKDKDKDRLSRIIMVMNTAYGEPEDLPFDLRTKRQMQYKLQKGEQKQQSRKSLEGQLEEALRLIFATLEKPAPITAQPTPTERAVTAIEDSAQNKNVLARRFMEWFTNEIIALGPERKEEAERDELLVQAIERTIPVVAHFGLVTKAAAEHDSSDVITTMYKGLEPLLQRYNLSPEHNGRYYDEDFDYFRFICHELFVTLISFLIQENSWSRIADLLDEELYTTNVNGHTEIHPFDDVMYSVRLLEHRNKRLNLDKISLRAAILHERHTQGDLGKIVPFEQFMNADYFLYLRSEFQKKDDNDTAMNWAPVTSIYRQNRVPRYLAEARRKTNAERLLRPLKVQDIPTLRKFLRERAPRLTRAYDMRYVGDFLYQLDIDKIGTT